MRISECLGIIPEQRRRTSWLSPAHCSLLHGSPWPEPPSFYFSYLSDTRPCLFYSTSVEGRDVEIIRFSMSSSNANGLSPCVFFLGYDVVSPKVNEIDSVVICLV
uniref:Uncharacterized protein n=1 Tax=Compsopogon caeruleus TaxID=31354 RepID=A0A6T6D7D4_9RHOD|mmetsp:Transcript_8953/g.18020  ORF Transcript_8953/g.18020 Transcript_8953/m.18020 type:complete len:105 (+) Transcript_8953:757-1071(+)